MAKHGNAFARCFKPKNVVEVGAGMYTEVASVVMKENMQQGQ